MSSLETYLRKFLGKTFLSKTTKFNKSLVNDSYLIKKLNMEKLNNVLFIGINKNEIIKKYIEVGNFYYLEIFDPSSENNLSNNSISINNFIPSAEGMPSTLYSISNLDTNATLFEKDLRWTDFNADKKFSLETDNVFFKKIKDKKYDMLFLLLNGYELQYLKKNQDYLDLFKIVKFNYSKYNIDIKNFFKDYFMFFKKNNFIILYSKNNDFIEVKKYTDFLEGDYSKIYYCINKKYFTKINHRSVSSYYLENYFDR